MEAFNSFKQFEHVKDNKTSAIRDMLSESIDSVGGYHSDIFLEEDQGALLSKLHKEINKDTLDVRTAQKKLGCLKINKVEELVVNEKSSMRDLNIAVLMTHWDYIAPVYFHRGVALMAVKRWQNAINDFEMALHHGYADENYRLHHKIGQCFVKLKQYKSATKSFTSALDNLNTSDVDEKIRVQFNKILKECIKKFSVKSDEKSTEPKLSPIIVNNPNKTDPRLHDSVEILEEVGKGRTAFAKNNIGVGTVIAVDNAFGGHLNPDDPSKTLQYCVQCLCNVSIPYPCPKSPRVVFCSKTCQDQGLSSSYKYQSEIDLYGMRQKDTKDGCSIFSGLSVLTSQPASFWIKNEERLLMSETTESEWPTVNASDLEKVINVFDMVTNKEKVSHDTNVRHAITVVLLLRALRNTSFYADSQIKIEKEGNLSKEEITIGKLLFKIRQIKDMNAHPVWGVELNPKDPENIGTEQIGQGLYTAIASYFNSACNPNTIRINQGKKMFLVAARNIRKGEEITDNYSIHFSDMVADQRRPWMEENFKFWCECEACEYDWPTYNKISSDRPSEKVADKLVELEVDNMTALEKGDLDKAILGHAKEISLIQSNLSEPHQLMVTIRTSFISCWWRKVAILMQKNK